jgi:antimicrobial peptide system SdpB family protein
MKNIFTNKLGIARSITALALLSTLLLNNKDVLFLENMSLPENPNILERLNLFLMFGYDNLYISYSIGIAILVSVLIGVYPRFTGILHWWVCFSFFGSSIIVEGGDQVAQILSLLLIPITLLDPRTNHFGKQIEVGAIRTQMANGFWFIIKLQAALLYLEAGVAKLYSSSPEWADGTGLYYWINNGNFGRGDGLVSLMNSLMTSPVISYLFTHSIIVLEISLFGMLFSTNLKLKKYLFIVAIMFHFSIVVYFGLVSFFLNMAGLLVIYLLDISNPVNLSLTNIYRTASSLLQRLRLAKRENIAAFDPTN